MVLELLNWLPKFCLYNPEVRFKKVKKEVPLFVQKVLVDNLRHNNCIIFLYLNVVFFRICTCYNLFGHRKKSGQVLICRVAKNLPVLELLIIFIKSSIVAYKRVNYKKNLVYSKKYPSLKKNFLFFLHIS